MKKTILLAGILAVTSAQGLAFAHEHEHGDGHMENMSGMQGMNHDEHMDKGMEMDMSNHGDMGEHKMFLEKKNIDGYDVSFHVMPAKAGMKHGGSHNVMIKVEKDGSALQDVVINSKVFLPNKTSDSKMMMQMGDWYMAGYDLDAEGKNGIMILFKTSNGKKHKGSVYYKAEK
ncbi:MAG: hypothetical protein R8M14_02200 [Ghiorsea sp.]